MNDEDRQKLIEFREQTSVGLDSARRMLELVRHVASREDGHEKWLETTQRLVNRLEETVVFIDLVLSGVEDS